MELLQGKTAIVTGGTRGIGLAVVRVFLQNGARVALFGSRQATADRAVAALKSEEPGWDVIGLAPDLTDFASVQAAVEAVRARFGGVDILVNNAGISAREPLADYKPEAFKAIMDLNVTAVFNGCKAVEPIMRAAGDGADAAWKEEGRMILLQLFWKICNNISCSNQAVILTLQITTFLRYIAYFSFGMLAYIYHKKMLRWIDTHHVLLMTGFILNLILIGGCWFAKYYLHILPLLEFVCFPLNLFLYSIIIAMLFRYACTLESQDSLSKRFMMYLGNYSFGLFLIHIIYMYVGSELLTLLHMSPQQLCFYPLLFIIMLSLSLLTMEALARVSWGHYFIGHVSRL